ncbi:MAG: hypothetical protein J0L62_17555 [Bacteroidetes bacterium]|nr:hypothetical protein [Bacteroidota bacterium]
MKFRPLLLLSFLMIFQFSDFLFAQPVKKNVYMLPDLVKTTSEQNLILLDSAFQVILSPINRYPLITSLNNENDSLWVTLTEENGNVNRLPLKSSVSTELSYPWVFAAGGTLALLILLYFVRF